MRYRVGLKPRKSGRKSHTVSQHLRCLRLQIQSHLVQGWNTKKKNSQIDRQRMFILKRMRRFFRYESTKMQTQLLSLPMVTVIGAAPPAANRICNRVSLYSELFVPAFDEVVAVEPPTPLISGCWYSRPFMRNVR